MDKMIRLFLVISTLIGTLHAQSAPNCPLWGPLFPAPTNVVRKTAAVPDAVRNLKENLDLAIKNGTLESSVSFHIDVFSTNDIIFDYSYASPGSNDSLTSGQIDKNTIFKIGSISKLLTVYSLLAATGMTHINDPVTKWVPELANAPFENDIDTVRWQDVTIGALAGHMAGVRDLSLADIAVMDSSTDIKKFGLPAIPTNEVPKCGSDRNLSACTRDEFFEQLQTIHPLTSAFNMPIYSNIAFQVLAYAIEGMTNKTFLENFESTLIRPLKLTGTYVTTPASTAGLNAIIPGDEYESWWKLDPGDATSSAMGFMFSTGADLAAIGQSILSSSLLSPALTRRWMKPTTNTADLRSAIGMPWEIFRTEITVDSPNYGATKLSSAPSRILDLYAKNGGIGAYNAEIVLSPNHGFGFTVLTAGRPPASGPDERTSTLQSLNGMVADAFLPAFETAAIEQAEHNFAGMYVADGNTSTPMTLKVVAGDGGLGLGVTDWRAGDLDLLKSFFEALQIGVSEPPSGEPSLRLYPVDLKDEKRIAFRGVYELNGSVGNFSTDDTTTFGSRCTAWAIVGEPQYGNIGLDDFVFGLDESGSAATVTARGARKTLERIT